MAAVHQPLVTRAAEQNEKAGLAALPLEVVDVEPRLHPAEPATIAVSRDHGAALGGLYGPEDLPGPARSQIEDLGVHLGGREILRPDLDRPPARVS